MNIQKAKTGHSFKGAFAYYLHDKGAETAERVAWTESRNLAADDPAFALSVMMATARSVDELKRAAGVKASGRKATTGPVYALSLAWHPDNAKTLDRVEMVRAADEVLQVLGVRHLQSVIVAHRDEAHPHVHIIINRIDPATGKAEPFSNDLHKLDAWANRYELERGKIESPNRAKKHEERAAREAAARAPQQSAQREQTRPQQIPARTRAALLAEQQAKQRDRHRQEWDNYREQTRAERSAVYAERIDYKAVAAQHRQEQRPAWSQLGRDQAAERRAFNANEKRLSGIIRNAIDVVRGQQIRNGGEDRGFLAMCFNFIINKPARLAAFNDRLAAEKSALSAQGDAALQVKFEAAKHPRQARLADLTKQHGDRRAALIARQDIEKTLMRDEWRRIYAERERKASLEQHADRSRARMETKTDQNLNHARRLDRRPSEAAALASRVQQPEAAPGRVTSSPTATAKPTPAFQSSSTDKTPTPAFTRSTVEAQRQAEAQRQQMEAQRAADAGRRDFAGASSPATPAAAEEQEGATEAEAEALVETNRRGRSKEGRGKGRTRTRSRTFDA